MEQLTLSSPLNRQAAGNLQRVAGPNKGVLRTEVDELKRDIEGCQEVTCCEHMTRAQSV